MKEPATEPVAQAATGAESELANTPAAQSATGTPEETPPPWAGTDDPLARGRYLHGLSEKIAEMSAHIDSATWRLLMAIAEYDRYEGWASEFPSCGHWLAYRCQLDMRTAQDRVRVARALEHLPQIGQALREGRLSYSKVRAVVRICGPENEGEMLYLALNSTTEQMERIVRGYRRATEGESLAEVAARQEERYLRIYQDWDGMVVIRARLTPEVGAVVKKALEAAMEVVKDRKREGAGGAEGEAGAGSVSEAASCGEASTAGSSHGTESTGRVPSGGGAEGELDLHALRAAHDPRDPVPRIDIGAIKGLPAWGVIEEDNGEEWVPVQTPRVDDDRDCWYPPRKRAASGGEGGEAAGSREPQHGRRRGPGAFS